MSNRYFFDSWLDYRLYREGDTVRENDLGYSIEIEMPGVKKEQVEVEVKRNTLIIEGERKRENSDKRFSRKYLLPEATNPASIECRMEDGLLSVFIPKKVPETHRIIVNG